MAERYKISGLARVDTVGLPNDPRIFQLTLNIEALAPTNPRCQAAIFGSFKVHNKGGLLCSLETSVTGHEFEAFAIITNLCKLAELTTRIPDRLSKRENTSDLILAFISSVFSNITLPQIALFLSNLLIQLPLMFLTMVSPIMTTRRVARFFPI